MVKTTIYDNTKSYFGTFSEPDWHDEAIHYLRGGKDSGNFGLYLYHLIKNKQEISTVINIGTARGYSAVCAAKALADTNRSGEVHTIDVIPPKVQRAWGSNSEDDPVSNSDGNWSMHDFISRFHSPSDDHVPIKFYTGDSSDVLTDIEISPDLVFHDGKHTYETVRKDMELINEMSSGKLIQVHDDCHLFDNISEHHLHNPINGSKIGDLPLFRRTEFSRRLKKYQYSITKRKFPGVALAVEEYVQDNECDTIEIIRDKERLPITTIWE